MTKEQGIHDFNMQLATAKQECLDYQQKWGGLPLKVIKEVAANLDVFVRSDDPRMSGSVSVTHQDGSHFFFRHAWYEKFGKSPIDGSPETDWDNRTDWLVVFTEHTGVHVFALSDLSSYNQMSRREIEGLK